ncbi:MAG TPA: hypothetical protein VF297_04335 [Pyrinomonadaceae bacterium]
MSTAFGEFRREKSQALTQEGIVPPLADLLENITERQQALFKMQGRLYEEARRASRLARYMRVAVILLGAFAATREVADRLFTTPDGETMKVVVVVIYTLMALAITAIGSISAALGVADKAAGLGALAAECNTPILKVDCEMPREDERATARRAGEARKLINYQNEKIGAIQVRAAELGVLVPGVRVSGARRLHATHTTVKE